MVTAKDYVGKTCEHQSYGKVRVTGRPKAARAIVHIECIQRRPGWDDITESYKRVKEVQLNPDTCPGAKTLLWRVHNKDEFGVKDEVHINELQIIES